MGTCFVCGEKVKDSDDYEWFGFDGDKIHKKCEPNLNKAYDAINNMSDYAFIKYMKGKRKLLDSH